MSKALFLDRDGILNKIVMRDGVAGSPRFSSEFEIIDDAKEVVKAAKNLNYLTVVVTNQPDIDRKKMGFMELEKMHQIIQHSFQIDCILVCMSGNNSDFRRKPNPGMLLEAAEKFNIDLKESFLLGDSDKDIIAGRDAGVKTILLQTGYNTHIHGTADYNIHVLSEVINILSGGVNVF